MGRHRFLLLHDTMGRGAVHESTAGRGGFPQPAGPGNFGRHSFASAAPNDAPFPPAAWEVEGEAPPQHLLVEAQSPLAAALSAAYSAGLDPSLVAAAAFTAGAAYAAARIRNRVAAAALHNDDAGPEGPEVLLPLADDVLVHFVNRLHSDRWVVRARD